MKDGLRPWTTLFASSKVHLSHFAKPFPSVEFAKLFASSLPTGRQCKLVICERGGKQLNCDVASSYCNKRCSIRALYNSSKERQYCADVCAPLKKIMMVETQFQVFIPCLRRVKSWEVVFLRRSAESNRSFSRPTLTHPRSTGRLSPQLWVYLACVMLSPNQFFVIL